MTLGHKGNHHAFPSLSVWTYVLVVGAFVLAVALGTSFLVFHNVESMARGNWEKDATAISWNVASMVDLFFQERLAQMSLQAGEVEGLLAQEPSLLESPGGLARLDERLEAFIQEVPGWHSTAVVGRNGRFLAYAPGPTPSASLEDRPYFQRALSKGQPVVSSPLVGRASGQLLVVLAVPVKGPDGKVAALVTGALPLERFQELADRIASGIPGVLLVVADLEGRFVAGHLPAEPLQSVFEATSLTPEDLGGNRVLQWRVTGEGEQVGAFARAPWSGWGVLVAQSRSALRAGARRQGLIALGISLGAIVLVGAPGLSLMLRHAEELRRLTAQAQALGQGAPATTSPSGRVFTIREMATLHNTFQEMGARIRAQQRQLMNAYELLRSASMQTLVTLVDALDMRERAIGYHSRRMGEFTRILARRMGLPDGEVERMVQGAVLHDIGKLAVPDAILAKPGPLTPDEWRIMRRHPRLGSSLLSGHPELAEVALMVLTHHERYDGKGYPLGLKGEEIPLGARIFAVVDAFDALIFDRPYRRARSMAEAREEIARHAGTQFDPRVVEVFLQVPDEEWLEAIRRTMHEQGRD